MSLTMLLLDLIAIASGTYRREERIVGTWSYPQDTY